MAGGDRFDVVVVGSLNHDLTVHAPRLPRPGETVLGTSHLTAGGGKGANQALAVARLGGSVALIGAVGDDDRGREMVAALEAEGVDTSGVAVRPAIPTGLAVITVDSSAENTIVVSPGANLSLTPEDLTAHAHQIAGAAVVLAQLEIPPETAAAAAGIAEGTFCLNPAPAQHLPGNLVDRVDVLVPNRSELAVLAGFAEPAKEEEVPAAVAAIGVDCPVVVTLGARGAVVVADGSSIPVPAPRVDAVDTTGAGDAFCGALAYGLARGSDLLTATKWGVVAGALAATKHGAQPSLPTLAQVESLLGE